MTSASAKQVAGELGIGIATCAVGRGLEYSDVEGAWEATREITDRGCLLVRPDRHIAWRSVDASAGAAESLRKVLQAILHPG